MGVVLVIGLGVFGRKPLIVNGDLNQNFEGWQTNAGLGIFYDHTPRNVRYFYDLIRSGKILHTSDLWNDHFAALGAGNVPGCVLSQDIALNGRGGIYELSFVYAATGDNGRVAVLDVSVTGAAGAVLASDSFTNTTPVQTWYVPRNRQAVEKMVFTVPPGTVSAKLTFADQSPDSGIAVDPLIKNVRLKRLK